MITSTDLARLYLTQARRYTAAVRKWDAHPSYQTKGSIETIHTALDGLVAALCVSLKDDLGQPVGPNDGAVVDLIGPHTRQDLDGLRRQVRQARDPMDRMQAAATAQGVDHTLKVAQDLLGGELWSPYLPG